MANVPHTWQNQAAFHGKALHENREKLEQNMENLTGLWLLDTVRLPAAGILRKGDDADFRFEFMSDGTAIAYIHAEKYPTNYIITNGDIVFDRIEIAALRLRLEGNRLYLHNYHGVTLVFQKGEKE